MGYLRAKSTKEGQLLLSWCCEFCEGQIREQRLLRYSRNGKTINCSRIVVFIEILPKMEFIGQAILY